MIIILLCQHSFCLLYQQEPLLKNPLELHVESIAVLTVVESVVVASVEDELPLQAVKKAATVKTSNNFFILFNFRFLNISYLYPYFKKVTQL